MPAKLEEITGQFLYERNRWDQTLIGSIENGDPHNPITIKGQADEDELETGMTYRFYGRWTEHPRHGRQFHFQTFCVAAPAGKRGIISYLQHAPGIGRALATSLWDHFGAEAVQVLREEPGKAALIIDRLSMDVASEAADFLRENAALEACSIDLVELFAQRGFPKRLVKEATKIWGNRAAAVIRKNPYLLMRFRSVGFLRCDALYIDLGLPAGRVKRQAYAAWYALAADTEGHTWHSVDVGVKGIGSRVSGADINAPAAIRLAKRAGLIGTHRDAENRLWLADGKKARQEEAVAEYIERVSDDVAAGRIPNWPQVPDGTDLSEHQRQQLHEATLGHVGILAGSPGTGKTFAAAALIREILRRHGSHQVAVCAPTGKAAVRVTEAMERNGIGIKATTIHRLLKVESADDGSGWSFVHGQNNPLSERYVIVDESSMIDTGLMANLLSARQQGGHVLFIGDPYQLPPVGHGAPLRDFIRAGLPCGELKEIRRNSGAIVKACAAIRDTSKFEVCPRIDLAAGENLICVEAHGPDRQLAALENLYSSLRKSGERDLLWDVQVLVPVNAKSQLARKTVNARLQDLLNFNGERVDGNPFRIGDKIICTKNGFLPANDPSDKQADDDGKIFVANGEMAEVLEVAPKITVARVTCPDRVVKIPRGMQQEKAGDDQQASDDDTGTGCNWDLAYAISTHKSQGSEFPVAVVMLDEYPGARMVMSRNWLFTAISRAKEVCVLIGKHETALIACRRDAIGRRKTFLRERIEAAEGIPA